MVGADRKHLGLGTAALRGPPFPAVARGAVWAQRTFIDLVSDDINPNVRKFLSEFSFADVSIEGPLLALSYRIFGQSGYGLCLPMTQSANGPADWTLVLI